MDEIPTFQLEVGDQVVVRWLDQNEAAKHHWVPGRVILVDNERPMGHHVLSNMRLTLAGWEAYNAPRAVIVRVALTLPYPIFVNNGVRLVPAGTPILYDFEPQDVRLVRHEPQWKAFQVKPFLEPDKYRIMGGIPQCPLLRTPGYTHVGAYLPSYWYHADDPVWVWSDGWRAAKVISSADGWIRIKYLNSFRDQKGNSSKGFRPPYVWAPLCDHSAPARTLTVDERWIDGSCLNAEIDSKLEEYPKYRFLSTRLRNEPELVERLKAFDRLMRTMYR